MLLRKWFVFIVLAFALLGAGCSSEAPEEAPAETAAPEPAPAPEPEPRIATASLQFSEAFSNGSGSMVFTEIDGGVSISAQVNYGGETPVGAHGFYFHETGDCSTEDIASSGDQPNPDDFGTIDIGEDFSGNLEMNSTTLSFDGENSIIGRAVILHAGENDLARSACGVVALSE